MNVILIAAFFLLFRIIFIFNFKTDTVRIERNCKNIIRGLYSLTDDIRFTVLRQKAFQILIRIGNGSKRAALCIQIINGY